MCYISLTTEIVLHTTWRTEWEYEVRVMLRKQDTEDPNGTQEMQLELLEERESIMIAEMEGCASNREMQIE